MRYFNSWADCNAESCSIYRYAACLWGESLLRLEMKIGHLQCWRLMKCSVVWRSTLALLTQSFHAVFSRGEWLAPSIDGAKTMPVGHKSANACASWPGPDCSDIDSKPSNSELLTIKACTCSSIVPGEQYPNNSISTPKLCDSAASFALVSNAPLSWCINPVLGARNSRDDVAVRGTMLKLAGS